MKPSFWSMRAHEHHREEWYQGGNNIRYTPSEYMGDINDLNKDHRKYYMQLSFDYTFKHENDQIFCCYTVPYSYSDLISHLN